MRALQATEVVSALVHLPGWRLHGEGEHLAIEKEWRFQTHARAMLFVNALAWLAETLDHHPQVVFCHTHCVVRWRTHDVKGLSNLDFEAARRTESLGTPVP
jgi:4a-hydroxytetrahydrobiopterin dehydratase